MAREAAWRQWAPTGRGVQLIWVNARVSDRRYPARLRSNVLKTYTLYLLDGAASPRFEPALCASDREAMAQARLLLARNPDCGAVEAHFGDQFLFRVEARPHPGQTA